MEPNERIKELRKQTGLNRKEFAQHFQIPLRTVEEWESGRRKPPEYIPKLIHYQILYEKECMKLRENEMLHKQEAQE